MNCCSHLFEIANVTPSTPNGCEECFKWLSHGFTCGFASPAATWVVATTQRTSTQLSIFIQAITRW